jgi:hypothetical protein
MAKFLFSYQATVEVEALTEDVARDTFWLTTDRTAYEVDDKGLPVPVNVEIIETDVMLVEVTE